VLEHSQQGQEPHSEGSQAVPSLREIHRLLGLEQRSLTPCIAATREGKATTGFSAKEQFGALEALIIESVWRKIEGWIQTHKNVFGLAKTNLPDYTETPHLLYEGQLKQRELLFSLTPLHEDELQKLRKHLLPFPWKERTGLLEQHTRAVLQYFLFQWEVQRMHAQSAEETSEECDAQRWYEKYCSLIAQHMPGSSTCPYPVTSILRSGFAFGNSLLWVVPRGAERRVSGELAHTHNLVIQHSIPLLNDESAYKPCSSRDGQSHMMLTPEVFASVLRNIRMLRQDIEREQRLGNNPSTLPIITGCPAFYTPAFAGIREWVEEVKNYFS